MTSEQHKQGGQLAPLEARALASRSQALARRGLEDIARMAITPERCRQLVQELYDDDYDVRASAAIEVADLATLLSADLPEACEIVMALASNLHHTFEDGSVQLGLFDHGERYYPPNDDFQQLLVRALSSIVGHVEVASDAVIWLFLHGGEKAKVKSAEWLGRREAYKQFPTLFEAWDGIDDDSPAQVPLSLSLALRFALASMLSGGAFDERRYLLPLGKKRHWYLRDANGVHALTAGMLSPENVFEAFLGLYVDCVDREVREQLDGYLAELAFRGGFHPQRLIQALRYGGPEARWAASEALGRVDPAGSDGVVVTSVLARLVSALSDEDDSVREAASHSLSLIEERRQRKQPPS